MSLESLLIPTAISAAADQIGVNEQRDQELQLVEFQRSVVDEAQAMGHGHTAAATHVTLQGQMDIFPVRKKVEYKPAEEATHDTPVDKAESERRAMYIRYYEFGQIQDDRDTHGTQYSQLKTIKPRLTKAASRLMSGIILDAIIKPATILDEDAVYETTAQAQLLGVTGTAVEKAALAASSVLGGRGFVPNIESNQFFKNNTYFNLSATSAGALNKAVASDLGDFDADTLTDLEYIIRRRDAEGDGQWVMTLTPELARILKKDEDFKNSERVFKIGGSVDSFSGALDYKGFYLINTSDKVLPIIHAKNLVQSTIPKGGGVGNASIVARSLNKSNTDPVVVDPYVGKQVSSGIKDTALVVGDVVKGAFEIRTVTSTAADGDPATADTVNKLKIMANHMIYAWNPNYLYWSMSGKSKMRVAEDPTKSFSTRLYSLIPCAAMLIQEDYALSFLLPNNGTYKLGVTGTGNPDAETSRKIG